MATDTPTRVHYGYVITRDHLDRQARNILGPRNTGLIRDEIIAHGKPFRLKDDDGNLCYEGMYCGPDDETMFCPLDCFGEPAAGCTTIEYANHQTGEWEAL